MQSSLYVPNSVSIISFLRIFYLPEAGAYYLWFIWSLWWMFVIIPLFKTRSSRVLLFIVSATLSYLPLHFTPILSFEETRYYMVFFMAGIMLYDWKQYISLNSVPAAVISLLLFILFELLFITGNTIVSVIIPYIAIYSCLSIVSLAGQHFSLIISRSLLSIASASFLIYLFHTTFMGFVKSIAIRSGLTATDVGFSVTTLVAVIVGVVMPMLLYRYILVRFPLARFMFGLKPAHHRSASSQYDCS